MFRNHVVAYTADLFGPYSMLTYDNDGYHFANFDAVLAHEMGHVFGALDEYAPPSPGYPSTGDLTSGYLGRAQPQRRERRDHGPAVHHARLQRDAERVRERRALPLDDRTDRAAGRRRATRDPTWWTRGRRSRPGWSRRTASGAVTLRGAVAERPRKRGVISTGVYFRQRPEHQGAARPALSGRRRRLAGPDALGRRLRRARRGLVADDRAPDAGPPRARSRGDDRRDGRPHQGPLGRPHAGHAGARDQRRLHEEGGDGRGRRRRARLRAQHERPACRWRASRRSSSCASPTAR